MSEDKEIMLVSNYLKRPAYRGLKEHYLRFTYLRFTLNTAPKLLFYRIYTIELMKLYITLFYIT